MNGGSGWLLWCTLDMSRRSDNTLADPEILWSVLELAVNKTKLQWWRSCSSQFSALSNPGKICCLHPI